MLQELRDICLRVIVLHIFKPSPRTEEDVDTHGHEDMLCCNILRNLPEELREMIIDRVHGYGMRVCEPDKIPFYLSLYPHSVTLRNGCTSKTLKVKKRVKMYVFSNVITLHRLSKSTNQTLNLVKLVALFPPPPLSFPLCM